MGGMMELEGLAKALVRDLLKMGLEPQDIFCVAGVVVALVAAACPDQKVGDEMLEGLPAHLQAMTKDYREMKTRLSPGSQTLN